MSHAVEYKTTCPAGHALFGPAAACGACGPAPAEPIILETKEHGRAVAYPDDEPPAATREERR